MNFKQLNLSDALLRAINKTGYTSPTAIQSKSIPLIREGKDVLACAQTGTGKTAAFALPILQNLQENKSRIKIQVLVLAPTRELALQIEESFKTYGQFLPVRFVAIYGGVKQHKQVAALKKGVEIMIATPGRLLDLMQQGFVDLSKVNTVVLDEADRMLDMGFIRDIRKILAPIPTTRQTLFFSATMPKSIRKFAGTILKNPVEVSVNPVSSTAQRVDQSVYFIEKKKKTDLLIHLLQENPEDQSLVFTRTKHGADRLVKKLGKTGIYAAAIHGNKSQNARQRALKNFKDRKVSVLVATDIASRGLDIEELPYVVNYELPNEPETYVHRIGRTGRAGKNGTAISFCDQNERKELKHIQKLIGFKVPVKQAQYLSNN